MTWTESELKKVPQITMWVPSVQRVHPTVRMNDIDIDELLAPLIADLWEAGIGTAACCQGDPLEFHISQGAHGSAYILFTDFDQAAGFLKRSTRGMTTDEGIDYVRLMSTTARSFGRASVWIPPLMIDTIHANWKANR